MALKIINSRYELVQEIGKGGNAQVYLAFDLILNQEVAIKILKHTIEEKKDLAISFNQETKTAAALVHPNIVKIYDIGVYEDHPYVVMEYIRGYSVKQLILKRGYLDLNEATMIILQIIDALSYAHKYKIIHRNIKHQNILIKSDGKAYLADFGTAFIMEETLKVEKSDVVIGTPHYIAPEVVKQCASTYQSDIYSLGCTFFEMLCGRTPYIGKNATMIAASHVKEDFPKIRSINTQIPESYENIILKATEKDLLKRYNNLNEFKADLLIAYDNYLHPKKISFWKKLFSGRKK